jgi:hypothetical protein
MYAEGQNGSCCKALKLSAVIWWKTALKSKLKAMKIPAEAAKIRTGA